MDGEDFIPFDLGEDFFEEDEGQKDVKKPPAAEERSETRFPRTSASVGLLVPIYLPPWVPPGRVYSSDLLDMLHEEIDDYVEYISPTPAEHAVRYLVIQRVEAAVQSLWPNALVQVFGSYETHLYLPSSDVDVVVFEPSLRVPACLWKLKTALAAADVYSKIEVIDKARVPIIKIVDKLSDLKVDISFNMPGGIHAAAIVKEFVADPQCGGALMPLMLILKQFLAQRLLNEVFMGGLGSYGLLILIASFLKTHPLVQTKQLDPKKNLGVLLIEFLELYGKHFNYDDVGIAVDAKGAWYFKKSSMNTGQRPSLLTLMDPQDSSNDVGRGSYCYHIVKGEFAKAYNLLTAMLGFGFEEQNAGQKARKRKIDKLSSILGFIISIKREVMEQRELLEILWEEIQSGRVNPFSGKTPPRKRSLTVSYEDQDEVIYTAESTDDEAPLKGSQGRKKQSSKRRKTSHF